MQACGRRMLERYHRKVARRASLGEKGIGERPREMGEGDVGDAGAVALKTAQTEGSLCQLIMCHIYAHYIFPRFTKVVVSGRASGLHGYGMAYSRPSLISILVFCKKIIFSPSRSHSAAPASRSRRESR